MGRHNTTHLDLAGRLVPDDHVFFAPAKPYGVMESPLNLVIDAIPTAVFVVEKLSEDVEDWLLVGINALHNKLSGLGSQQGKRFREWCPEAQRTELFSNYNLAADAWNQISYEEELDLPGGKRWWTTTLMPLKSNSGRIRVVGSARDISDTVRTEKALAEFVPICSVCKSVKTEGLGADSKEKTWVPIEAYLQDKKLTHGYCPTCFERLYGDLRD